MTLKLILMRHAKSDWNNPDLEDFERPLNQRGTEAAKLIGQWLAAKNILPECVLCSSATRTRETCRIVTGQLCLSANVHFSDRLYLASAETMFQSLSLCSRSSPAMLIAHNPGTAILAHILAKHPAPHPRFSDYPTAATTIIDFESDNWSEISAGTGKIVDFVVPRELK